ncbi:MAG: GNAT family protein [Brevundimonas sp.]|nr:GNAT family protein [Brevundimonas sp.]
MALLDWISDAGGPVVEGRGVILRSPRASDHEAWAALRRDSYAYLQPWEPTWPEDDLTRAAFRRRLSIYQRELDAGNAWPFFVFIDHGRTLAGAITLSNVRRGVAETGTIGYWIGRRFAGQGLATASVTAMRDFAFTDLKLHRVEASCVPHNTASRRVLEKSGFALEGKARAYLKINGAWADHLLFGCVNDGAGRAG